MSAAVAPLRPELAKSIQVAADAAPQRELDPITLGEIRKWLTLARQDLQTATLHARGNPRARATLIGAGQAVRAALDVFEAAYQRGRI